MENTSSTTNTATGFNSWLSGKWLTENSGWIMDLYSKQMKAMASALSDFYQFYDTKNLRSNWADFSFGEWNPFFRNYPKNGWSPLVFTASNNIIPEMISQGYTTMLNRFSQFNQEIFNSFHKQLQNDEKDFHQFNQVFENFLNQQIQLSQQVMDAMNNSMSNRINFQSDVGKKVMDAMIKQFSIISEQNKKMMNEWNNLYSTKESGETGDKMPKQKKKDELVSA